MSLDNLVGISLERITVDAVVIGRLLSAAGRNIADAHVSEISVENRFDAAYKAIMQLANAALQANGYRTLTSKPGHHRTMIQTLDQTVGLDKPTIIALDALRKQRMSRITRAISCRPHFWRHAWRTRRICSAWSRDG